MTQDALGSAPAARQRPAQWLSGRRARVLLCASGVSFMIMLDSNIVAVSLPSIARSLGVTFIPLLHLLLSGCEPNEVNNRSERGLCSIIIRGG